MDFFTIALYETGHILGLLHAPGDPADIMVRATIEYQASWSRVLRDIDGDSAYGAALLYTIPIPDWAPLHSCRFTWARHEPSLSVATKSSIHRITGRSKSKPPSQNPSAPSVAI
jgi:hypothetical protein